jgi:arsenate reductase
VNPFAIELLEKHGMQVGGLRSKNWDEFAREDAPRLDLVFTVCDNAAAGVCPVWPGRPIAAHWGVADPAAVTGSDNDRRKAFAEAFGALKMRIDRLLALPREKIDRAALQEIGKI